MKNEAKCNERKPTEMRSCTQYQRIIEPNRILSAHAHIESLYMARRSMDMDSQTTRSMAALCGSGSHCAILPGCSADRKGRQDNGCRLGRSEIRSAH